MNIGSMHSNEDEFYLPLWSTSSSTNLSAPSFTSQSGNFGTIGFFTEMITADSSFQTLDVPSLPMNSQYYTAAEVHDQDFNFLNNVSELDSDQLESSRIWTDIPPALRHYIGEDMPNENPQQIMIPDISFSTHPFPVQGNVEGWMLSEESLINGATNSTFSNINVEANVHASAAASTYNVVSTGSEIIKEGTSNRTGKRSSHQERGRKPGSFRKKPKRSSGDKGSNYRGVSRYTGRYEAFLWDNTNPGQKPKTVYVGGFDSEKEAARAYDLAALKLWGDAAPINFSLSEYEKEMEEMQHMTKKEYLLSIRRKSKGFSKGISSFRGVSRNSDYKKWQARLGKGRGMRSIYIGTFDTEEEAARAYDVAAIRMKGLKAITNFEMSNYDVKAILASEKLPIGKGASKVLKKISVDAFLLAKKNNGKNPVVCLQLENSSNSLQPSSQQQSFEQLTTLAAASNNQISLCFQQNCNNANQVSFHDQNLSSSFLYATDQELTQIGGGETSGGNLSDSSNNLVFPYSNGVLEEQSLTMMETSELIPNGGIFPNWNQPIQNSDQYSQFHQSYEHTNQLLQHQIPSYPVLGYENPNFLTNSDFLHGSIIAGRGFERNEIYMGGHLNGGMFPGENGVLNGNSTVTDTGDYSDLGTSWGGIQQVEELEQALQTLQQNQMFQYDHEYAGNDINLFQDQNPDPFHSLETQNLESHETNPNFLYGCLNGVDQMNVGTDHVNFSSCVRGLPGSSGFPEESLMVMETETENNNSTDAGIYGGFHIDQTPMFMEDNSAPRSLEKGDQLAEDFGLDMLMSDFEIDSFFLNGNFHDELTSFSF